MATKITVPELGESVVEATVGHWLKKEGDYVNVGDVMVGLETEKVDLEVGAERAGVLTRIERKEGETVRIGDLLGVIEEAAKETGEAMKENAHEGQEEIPKVAATSQREREEFQDTRQPPKLEEKAIRERQKEDAKRMVSPLARRMAHDYGVDLAQVPTGDISGRVRQRDVQKYLKNKGDLTTSSSRAPTTLRDADTQVKTADVQPTTVDRSRREERVRMSRRRLTIARRLVEAQRTAAMLTTFNEIDMSAVMELRKRLKESFKERHGVSLGIVSFFVKTSIAALREFPQLNAEIQGEEMVLKHYYDIGVAVGASKGLVVPVLRNADCMSFVEIEKAIKEYARKAEDGTLSLEDLRGGSFTITNGGVFGSLLSTPILNSPQVGILGLHKIQERPVASNGQVVVHPVMYVALTYDHRLVDGREAVQFLVRVKELVEDPEDLLLED